MKRPGPRPAKAPDPPKQSQIPLAPKPGFPPGEPKIHTKYLYCLLAGCSLEGAASARGRKQGHPQMAPAEPWDASFPQRRPRRGHAAAGARPSPQEAPARTCNGRGSASSSGGPSSAIQRPGLCLPRKRPQLGHTAAGALPSPQATPARPCSGRGHALLKLPISKTTPSQYHRRLKRDSHPASP